MTPQEVVIIVLGGALGYWAVSTLINRRKGEPPLARQLNDGPTAGERPQPEGDKSSSVEPEWNQVLSVSTTASPDEIRDAYRSLITQYHPDRVASLGIELRELAERKSQEITAAYVKGLEVARAR